MNFSDFMQQLPRISRQEEERRQKEFELLSQIELLTDQKTAEAVKEICHSKKNVYTFDTYLKRLKKVYDALAAGAPVQLVLDVIDNRVQGINIDKVIFVYQTTPGKI